MTERLRTPIDTQGGDARLVDGVLARQWSPSAPLGAQATLQEAAPFHGADS